MLMWDKRIILLQMESALEVSSLRPRILFFYIYMFHSFFIAGCNECGEE